MSEDIGEEGQQSRDGLSAPNSEPGSAAQSPRGDQHEEEDDENGEGEGEEGEGEEGEDGQDESDSEGDENGEDEAQEAQDGQATGEAGERPENTTEPQRQASTAAADQKPAQPAKPAPSKEKRGRVRKWERKLVRIGHLQLLKWVPLEPREASQIERSEKAAMLKRQVSDSAPVTRSTTAAYHQRVRLERRAATRNVSYRDQEEESADPSDADDSAVTGKRRRDDD